MPKKILLIENDQALAGRLSDALEAAGFSARTTGDGKEGLELARDWAPDAVVLCVELPSMSGYLVCQKLKKDDGLKAIPLVLTSAEATEETFEKHRTLKARADDYLLKPYEPPVLVEKLGALVGMPEAARGPQLDDADEEIVSLEAEVGLESAPGEPDAELPALSLDSLADEPATPAALDDDLRLLDDAFDGIAAPTPAGDAAAALDELTGEKPLEGDALDAAVDVLPDDDARASRTETHALDDADVALGALADVDETLSPGISIEPPAGSRPARGASADLLRAAGIKLLDEERPAAIVPPPPPDPDRAGARDADAPRLGRELRESTEALERARADVAARDGQLRDLRRDLEGTKRRAEEADGLVEAAQEKARRAEADAKAGREEARRAAEQARAAEAELAELRRKAAEAEKRAAAAEQEARRKAEEVAAAADAVRRAETLERELEGLRTELLVARGEADGARGEVERRTADLKKRVAELEATNAKNEERVVKAYQKIKADEKVRDKVRKALSIASQILDEGLPAADSAADKERRAVGRE